MLKEETEEIRPILENIYLGNYLAGLNYQLLKYYKINFILICSPKAKEEFSDAFKYKKLLLYENPEKASFFFDEAHDFIKTALKSKESVLVLSDDKQNTSFTIVTAYYMKKTLTPAKKSLIKLSKNCPKVQISVGSLETLSNYEIYLKNNPINSITCKPCNCLIQ